MKASVLSGGSGVGPEGLDGKESGKEYRISDAPARVVILLIVLFTLMGLAGCSRSPVPEYFLLSPLEAPADSPDVKARKTASAGIGPVTLPAYLERPQIVSRETDGRLRISEYHKWAGSLKQDMTRTLARNLRILLNNDNLHAFPWDRSISLKYRITVSIDRFDAVPGQTAALHARWNLFRHKKLLASRRAEIRIPVDGKDYPALVNAKSLALSALSKEIAEASAKIARDLSGAGK